MRSFPQIQISELIETHEAELQTGPFGTQLKASEYTETGTPVINVRNIGMGNIKADKLEFISNATRDRLSSHILRSGDIVFGRKGAVERHVFIRKEQDGWFQGSDCIRLRLDSSRILPLFASYFFITREHQQWMMNQCSHGATMASLNQDVLRRIVLPLPDLEIQRKIVGIMSAYDELIENSQQRVKILEAMARALYREWFVHFRYPGHEVVPLVSSAHGDIPQGWEVTTLGQQVDLRKGKNITKATIRDGIFPVVAGGLKPAYFHDVPNTNGPVITVSASGANAGYIHLYFGDVWASDCSYIDSTATAHIFYYYLWIDHRRALVSLLQRGSAQPHVYTKDLEKLEALRVPEELIAAFCSQVTPIFHQVKLLAAKINSLEAARDLLLPRLLSGQIDVERAA